MNREDMLLVKLMEECGEVVQACSKALRFGLKNTHPRRGGRDNKECITDELSDVLLVASMLKEEGFVGDYQYVPLANYERVDKYMEVSRKLGRWS